MLTKCLGGIFVPLLVYLTDEEDIGAGSAVSRHRKAVKRTFKYAGNGQRKLLFVTSKADKTCIPSLWPRFGKQDDLFPLGQRLITSTWCYGSQISPAQLSSPPPVRCRQRFLHP